MNAQSPVPQPESGMTAAEIVYSITYHQTCFSDRARSAVTSAGVVQDRTVEFMRRVLAVYQLCEDARDEGNGMVAAEHVLTLLDGRELAQLEGGER
ncbi:MAG TPA: hypothetical protein VFX70_17475 [Mycobacteriales bacterium]|nr:hypothetical protein [Mycobacteriales bacterium]